MNLADPADLTDVADAVVRPTGVLRDPTAATLSGGNRLPDSLAHDLAHPITSLTNTERNER